MPSMSGWVLRARPDIALVSASDRFYALDVGLGVARQINPRTQCRRMRFYALDVGLGVARTGGWLRTGPLVLVSMPSMSGWVLRGMLRFGACEQGGWGRLRHPCLGGECSRPTAARRAGRAAVSWEDALRQPGCSGVVRGGAVHGGRCGSSDDPEVLALVDHLASSGVATRSRPEPK